MDIVKAVIPAAGLGTRFYPFTKAVPKEMIPLLNKPAIQYSVEEGIASAISTFLIVTGRGKEAIEEHFDPNPELEAFLKERGKLDLIASLKKIEKAANFCYVRQPEALGLGHAVWLARHFIQKEYFGVLLPDDIIISKTPAFDQLAKIARQEKASVIAVQEVPNELVSSYGVISIKKQLTPNLFQVGQVVEKPERKDAPSNLAIIGRYILSHKIFNSLETIDVDDKGELQLTNAIAHMMHNNEKVFAYKVQGVRYDIGTPLGWIKATIGCALQDQQCSKHITELLENKELLEHFMYNPAKIVEQSL